MGGPKDMLLLSSSMTKLQRLSRKRCMVSAEKANAFMTNRPNQDTCSLVEC